MVYKSEGLNGGGGVLVGEVVSDLSLVSCKSEVKEVKEVKEEEEEEEEECNRGESNGEPNLEIILNNVVCNFSVRCHLNLRQIAMNGRNVEYHKSMAMLVMKLREPRCTASIWSSGKITMTGATNEEEAKKGARRCARIIQKLGFKARFTNYRIVNVLATCTMPFAIKIAEFASAHPRIASYEPELHPGCTYKLSETGATLKIFSTGSITVTGKSVEIVQGAIESAYGLVYEYRKERREADLQNYPIQERIKRRKELRLLKESQKNTLKRAEKRGKRGGASNGSVKGGKKKRKLDESEEEEEEDEEEFLSSEEEEEDDENMLYIKTEVDAEDSEEDSD